MLRSADRKGLSRAAIASLVIHALLWVIFLALPEVEFRAHAPLRITMNTRKSVRLYLPRVNFPEELTQKDPNKGKIRNELDAFSAVKGKPAPRVFQAPPSPRGPAPEPAPMPVPTTPKLDIPVNLPQVAGVTGTPALPQAPVDPQPRLENIAPSVAAGTTNPRILVPRTAVGDVAKSVGPPGGAGGGPSSDGDRGASSTVEGMQLLSDPRNVDFRPYLQQVAARVRQRWFSIAPAIARTMRRQGVVVLQFAIDRNGQVPKVVIATPSNTAFDQAAVASLSQASPFPPLPNEFAGSEIRLQMALTFNVPQRR